MASSSTDISAGGDDAAAYHLLVDRDELPVLRTALALLADDATRDSGLGAPTRAIIERLPAGAATEAAGSDSGDAFADGEHLTLALSPTELKVVHTSLQLLRDDLRRGQGEEIHIVLRLLAKLPDEHAIRAITID